VAAKKKKKKKKRLEETRLKAKAKPKARAKVRKKTLISLPSADGAPPLLASLIMAEIAFEAIAARAFVIWERKIRSANDSAQNWREAEAELRAELALKK
jgi:hypothetical protein